jgi:hypothetical protein
MRLLFAVLACLLCLLPEGSALAFGRCTAPGYLDAFVPGLEAQDCEVIGEYDIVSRAGPSTLRLIRLASSAHGDDAALRGHVEQLAVALGPAFDAIGTARPPRYISILLADREEIAVIQHRPSSVHAEVVAMFGDVECAMNVYKLPDGAGVDDFVFTLAHEVFHCAQNKTWPTLMGDGDDWWVEGSAEYFAHLALPGYNSDNGFFDAFDQSALTVGLTAMHYETVVFFLWLATEGGPEAVGGFLAQMRPGDQPAVLRGLITPDDWTRFIEAWMNGEVQRPSGVPLQPQIHTLSTRRFTGPDSLATQTAAFTIPRWGLIFARDKVFDLSLTPPTAPPTVRMREDGSRDWVPPPERVNTCDDERTFLLYAATTEAVAEAELAVDTDADTTGGTCCLVGKWTPDDEALQGFADFGTSVGGAALAGARGSMSCGYAGGSWLLTFDEDGGGSIAYDGYANQCTGTMRGGQIHVDNLRSGATVFRWRVTGPGAAWLEFVDHSMTQSMQVEIGPMVQDLSGAYPGPATEETGLAFTCDGNRLTVQGMFDLLHGQAGHSRVSLP